MKGAGQAGTGALLPWLHSLLAASLGRSSCNGALKGTHKPQQPPLLAAEVIGLRTLAGGGQICCFVWAYPTARRRAEAEVHRLQSYGSAVTHSPLAPGPTA